MRARSSLPARLLLGGLAALLTAQLAGGVAVQVRDAVRHLHLALHLRHEDARAARRRALGEPYTLGIEQAEAAVPPDGEYVLFEREHSGYVIVLQGDLAPRRALLLTSIKQLRTRWRHRSAHRLPAVTVVFYGMEQAPQVLPTADVVASGTTAWH